MMSLNVGVVFFACAIFVFVYFAIKSLWWDERRDKINSKKGDEEIRRDYMEV